MLSFVFIGHGDVTCLSNGVSLYVCNKFKILCFLLVFTGRVDVKCISNGGIVYACKNF